LERKKGIKKYAGLIPVLAIALALSIELALGLRGQYVFSSAFLLLGVNLVIVCGVSFVIAYLSAKGYLLTGSLTLLFIMMAFVLIAIVSIASGVFSTFSPNASVTIVAIGLLLFSALQVLSSFQASFRSVPFGSEHRKVRFTLTCLASVSTVGLLSLLIWLNVFPPFFINGVGVTLIDQAVYAIVVLLFSLSSGLFLWQYLKTKSNVLYWYTLALALDAMGSFGLTLQVRFSDIVVWTGRLGLYIGTIYFLIALLSSRKK
jgi:hypothetical protein